MSVPRFSSTKDDLVAAVALPALQARLGRLAWSDAEVAAALAAFPPTGHLVGCNCSSCYWTMISWAAFVTGWRAQARWEKRKTFRPGWDPGGSFYVCVHGVGTVVCLRCPPA